MNIKKMEKMIQPLISLVHAIVIIFCIIIASSQNYLLRALLSTFSLLLLSIAYVFKVTINYIRGKQFPFGLEWLNVALLVSVVIQLFCNVFQLAAQEKSFSMQLARILIKKVYPYCICNGDETFNTLFGYKMYIKC